ncbi:hypothetical protein JAAARDRAFT_132762 [Jaapia argillacea MUCL 33604]|uniref:Uncharacterized protein n=1 Tax=Jaapia argillacea MUCL 33604 TaxID=933084 RepID=A0A067PYW7_9AGAM|nr:hypothetical protein JAAARDRAFT_132762 [Jaapia argillacea MUCL 33604]
MTLVRAKQSLPAEFTGLYRLFLRSLSVAVLDHPGSTSRLRRIWAPTFRGAGQVIRRLQTTPKSHPERVSLERWLNAWNQRIDNTLALLVDSAQSRGLSHKITHNFAHLHWSNQRWSRYIHHKAEQIWLPNLAPDSEVYWPGEKRIKQKNTEEKVRRAKELDVQAWSLLGEVVRMAEATGGMSLGRMPKYKRTT